MKITKVRFYNHKNGQYYHIQRKTWWGGWKFIGFTVDMGYGSVFYYYCCATKEELLAEVLEKYYKTDKRFTMIEEYPEIKMY
jgi:hypothetical protein